MRDPVDEDVDASALDDVLWALRTRTQGDLHAVTMIGVGECVRGRSQDPIHGARLPTKGITASTIVNATVPYGAGGTSFAGQSVRSLPAPSRPGQDDRTAVRRCRPGSRDGRCPCGTAQDP